MGAVVRLGTVIARAALGTGFRSEIKDSRRRKRRAKESGQWNCSWKRRSMRVD